MQITVRVMFRIIITTTKTSSHQNNDDFRTAEKGTREIPFIEQYRQLVWLRW